MFIVYFLYLPESSAKNRPIVISIDRLDMSSLVETHSCVTEGFRQN